MLGRPKKWPDVMRGAWRHVRLEGSGHGTTEADELALHERRRMVAVHIEGDGHDRRRQEHRRCQRPGLRNVSGSAFTSACICDRKHFCAAPQLIHFLKAYLRRRLGDGFLARQATRRCLPEKTTHSPGVQLSVCAT